MTRLILSTRSRLIVNAAANWLGTLAQMAAVFVISPVLVHRLGDQRYGVWAIVESILAYLTLFDLGIGAAVVRYIARFEGARDLQNINRTFSASLCLFAIAGLGVLAVASIVLWPAWDLIPVPREYNSEAWWQLALLSFNLAVGLPLGVFAAVLDGLQRYAAKSAVRTGLLVVRSIALVWVVTHGGGLLYIALAVTIVALVEHGLLAILAFRFLPGLRFASRLVDSSAMRMIGGYSIDAFLAMIAGRISFQTDAIVIGAFLPLSQITFFAIPARLVEHAKGALRSITTVLTPHISRLEGQNDLEAIRRVFIKGTRYVLWLMVPVQIGLWTLGKPFLTLWIGPEHAERGYPVLAILALPLALALSQSVSGRILYGIGKLKFFSRMLLVEAGLNLLLSLILVRPFGIVGVAWGTALPNLLLNLCVGAYTCQVLGVGVPMYLRSSFVEPCLAGVVLALMWLSFGSVLSIESWAVWMIAACVGCVAYALGAFLFEAGPQSIANQVRRRRIPLVFGLGLPTPCVKSQKAPEVVES